MARGRRALWLTTACFALCFVGGSFADSGGGSVGVQRLGDGLGSELAAALLRQGADRAIGPDEWERSELDASGGGGLVVESDLDALVGGSVLREGKSRRLRVQVREAGTGNLVSEYSVALEDGAATAPVLDQLAAAILQGLDAQPARIAVVPPSAKESAESVGTEVEWLRSGEPVAIESTELEVTQRADEGRHLVFLGDVRVTQGDLTLEADRLEAFYPSGSSRPGQLEASGNVRVVQGDRSARCQTAIYDRERQQLFCKGQAELVQGCETVRGSEIQFDLLRERVRVIGAASVVIQPGGATSDCGEAAL